MKYRGVSYHCGTNKWRARIHYQGKEAYLGVYCTPEHAAWAYNLVAEKLGYPLNKLPASYYPPQQPKRRIFKRLMKTNQSRYRGVSWDRGAWRATIYHNKKCRHLGRYQSIEQAAQAYNEAARELHGGMAILNPITRLD